MLDSPVFQTKIKFVSDSVIFYSTSVEHIGRRIENGKNLKEDRKKAYQGEITKSTQKRIKNNLYAWLYSLRVGNKKTNRQGTYKEIKLIMITVTLSSKQIHDDKTIKAQLLEPFITWLKTKHLVENYMWKAESQKNGNIHFHIITDKYINKKDLQEQWNKIQNKLSYVDRYFETTKKINPPSTQVQIFDCNEKAINYQLKYMTKESEHRKIEGLQMRVSNKLSHLKVQATELSRSYENILFEYCDKNCKRKYSTDYSVIYYFDCDTFNLFNKNYSWKEINKYYETMYKAMYINNLKSFELNLINLLFNDIKKFIRISRELISKGIDMTSFMLFIHDLEIKINS